MEPALMCAASERTASRAAEQQETPDRDQLYLWTEEELEALRAIAAYEALYETTPWETS